MRTKGFLSTGFLVGTLDAVAAVIQFKSRGGQNPVAIAKYIASGVLGPSAFAGGTSEIILGILLHYSIAMSWVIIFFLIYPKIRGIRTNPYIVGVLYGIFIWLVMNLLVIPFSRTPSASRNIEHDLVGVMILIVAVGLPISIIHKKIHLKSLHDPGLS